MRPCILMSPKNCLELAGLGSHLDNRLDRAQPWPYCWKSVRLSVKESVICQRDSVNSPRACGHMTS